MPVAEVRVDDFVIPELGRAVPYGVYDIAGNAGWVSVGIDHDTAAFAAAKASAGMSLPNSMSDWIFSSVAMT